MPIDYPAQTVLITGASSGLGAEFARQLASRGASLVLVARRRERLDALADELAAAHRIRTHVIDLDLAQPNAGDLLSAEVAALGVDVTSLINNAGFGVWGAVHETDPQKLRDEIALNITTLVDVTRAFISRLRAGRGFLINVGSVAAWAPTPKMAVYSGSKAFVVTFTEALWHESLDSGLRVLALAPGATETEFFEVVGTTQATGGTPVQTSAQVVTTALKALDARSNRPVVISGFSNKASTQAVKLLPRKALLRMIAGLTK